MIELKYKTGGMSEPYGKPRVYFACHPADFDAYFDMVSEDILAHANCSVWYDPHPEEPYDENELEEILDEMQLCVFAVTSIFLHEDNRARLADLKIALKKHIPILPIMLEERLGYEFSNTCAKIQVVRRNDKDPTATPYEDVLDRFLKSVLIGDELAEKVRNAFDAYVFLSYRKKDRSHAQRLMRMIHENKEYRDIAIWYDEFLVPGEGFNEAIADAFEKSSLFAMAVTPHLEEKGNYVMRVEYPMARDRSEKAADFAVVPVELYRDEDKKDGKDWRIDPEELKKHEEFKYRQIDDLKDEHRRSELDQTFIDALERIAKKKNDGSSMHRFFIGLAYLCGIDVEINKKTALELLTSAAEDKDPCPEASAKLADMYRNGDGVTADLQEAIRWQNLLAKQYLALYEKNHDPDEHKGYGTRYFKALCKLSDMQKENGRINDAIESVQAALAFSDALEEEVGIREQQRDKALILNRLGSLYREKGRYKEAEDCFKKALRIYEKHAHDISTSRAKRDLSIAYERLGDVCRDNKDLASALGYYEKTEAIRKELYSESHDDSHARRDYAAVLTKLGNIRKAEKKYNDAMGFYSEALQLDRITADEIKTPQAWDDYGVSLTKTGDIHKACGRYEEASDVYAEARLIFRKYMDKTGSRGYTDHYAGGCSKLAGIRKRLHDSEAAESLYLEACEYRKQLYEASDLHADVHNYASSLYNAALFLKDEEMMRKAYGIWNSLCTEHPEYEQYRDKALKHLNTEKRSDDH